MRTTLTVAAVLSISATTASAGDGPEHALISAKVLKNSTRICEKIWPTKKKPSVKLTDRCLQYWLFEYAYERPRSLAGVEDALSMDPTPLGGARFRAATFRAMARHVRAAFPGESGWLVMRALELFDGSAESYVSFGDINADMIGALKTIIAGKPFSDNIEAARATNLWLLRNAVYARHGREFKHPDLNHYFYGKWKRPPQLRGVLPLGINPKFADRMLTKTDRATVRRIRKVEKQ